MLEGLPGEDRDIGRRPKDLGGMPGREERASGILVLREPLREPIWPDMGL
ncbi:hypothetical protein BN1723_011172 [Verticillium longisporum]|uniref:Uncharacterized protein n=1 Tax=Verticillium longisporum TaxID=100787 RepID=A0A0G4L5I1_VERLO|nr:hypothetical protein BN1723_011172 [Verticillium longisporum]